MSEHVSQATERWLDRNRTKMLRRIDAKTRTNKDKERLAKALSKQTKNVELHADFTKAAIDLKAPPAVVKELKTLQRDAARRFRTLGPKGEAVLRGIAGDVAKDRGTDAIVKRIVRASARGDISVSAASDLLVGVNAFTAYQAKDDGKIPLWCLGCFIVFTLWCFLSSECRGAKKKKKKKNVTKANK